MREKRKEFTSKVLLDMPPAKVKSSTSREERIRKVSGKTLKKASRTGGRKPRPVLRDN